MNKVLKGLLVAMLAVSSQAHAVEHAHHHTSKTFMQPRSHGVNLATNSVGFSRLVERKAENVFGGSLQVAGYWQQSKDTTKATPSTSTIPETVNKTASYFLDSHTANHIVLPAHNHLLAVAAATPATLSMNPLLKSWGLTFGYNQDLRMLWHGLYAYANLPVAHAETNMNATASADATRLTEYFAGTLPAGRQENLKFAKINGAQKKTGVADLHLGLGYKFFVKDNYSAQLGLALTVPTGNKSTGEFAFEPMIGNGGHVGLGFDLDGQAHVWGDEDSSVKVTLAAQYRYLFDAENVRTLGLKDFKVSQYALTVRGGAVNADELVPLANVTTKAVNVNAGNQFEGLLGLAYNNGGFTFDLGYNLYYRDAEKLELKADFADENKYAIAHIGLPTGVIVGGPLAPTFGGGVLNVTHGHAGANANAAIVNKANLDRDSAATPSQLTHKVCGGVSYTFQEWENPVMVSAFAGYEFANKNSALEQWNVGGKAGLSF